MFASNSRLGIIAALALSFCSFSAECASAQTLEAMFSADSGDAHLQPTIGRLAVVLLRPGQTQHVPADRPLRVGEKFRLEVTSNRDGWLRAFQQAANGDVGQLWPRSAEPRAEAGGDGEVTRSTLAQRIVARRTYTIPDRGVFVFNPSTASEQLYVVINAESEQHSWLGEPAADSPSTSDNPPRALEPRNYLIKDPFEGAPTGLTFDPSEDIATPYLYFSAPPQDLPTRAVVRVELRRAL